ncbi:hypothetical protein B0H13DRAFT_2359136 [Mycena leptocephala]|nr:hypothetical protein B0H13DRAFT_2359136 [Mycena leptocephala]
MSRSRDNPDPRLIVDGPRQRKQAPTLSDPNNGETEIAAMEALAKQIDTLTRKLPSSVPIAARESDIPRLLALPGRDGDAASTFNRRMDLLFGEDLRDAAGRLKYVVAGKYGMGAVVDCDSILSALLWMSRTPKLLCLSLIMCTVSLRASNNPSRI